MSIKPYPSKRSLGSFSRASFDKDTRILSLAFASEEPVERSYGIEVLSCLPENVNISRLNNGAPLLREHDTNRHIGTVISASVDPDRVCRALVKLSASATNEIQDIEDGIITKVSVGYEVKDVVSKREVNGNTEYTWSWEPLEISLVAIPADDNVGIGRNIGTEQDKNGVGIRVIKTPKQEKHMSDTVKQDASEIMKLANEHKALELGAKFVTEGKSLEDFRGALLHEIKERTTKIVDTADLGLSQKEQARYSLRNAILSQIPGSGVKADFELEISNELAKRANKSNGGVFIPHAFLAKRDVTKGSTNALVQNYNPANDFIASLNGKLVAAELGVKTMAGLVGDIAIPAFANVASVSWVTEGNPVSETTPTFTSVTGTPKTCGAFVDVTRKMLKQSSPDVEELIKDEITTKIAVGIDTALFAGTGTEQPTGIYNHADINTPTVTADAPTWAQVLGFEAAILADNAAVGPMKWALAPNTWALCAATAADSGSGLMLADVGTKTMGGHPYVVSSLVTTKTGILGVWEQIIIGLWSAVEILVDPYTASSSGTVRLVAMSDLDVIIRSGKSFAKGTFIS